MTVQSSSEEELRLQTPATPETHDFDPVAYAGRWTMGRFFEKNAVHDDDSPSLFALQRSHDDAWLGVIPVLNDECTKVTEWLVSLQGCNRDSDLEHYIEIAKEYAVLMVGELAEYPGGDVSDMTAYFDRMKSLAAEPKKETVLASLPLITSGFVTEAQAEEVKKHHAGHALQVTKDRAVPKQAGAER